jgi:hypothetical protein
MAPRHAVIALRVEEECAENHSFHVNRSSFCLCTASSVATSQGCPWRLPDGRHGSCNFQYNWDPAELGVFPARFIGRPAFNEAMRDLFANPGHPNGNPVAKPHRNAPARAYLSIYPSVDYA